MYYVAKFFEASGLTLLGYAFIRSFGEKMNYRVFAVSILLFACGWIMERFLLKNQ